MPSDRPTRFGRLIAEGLVILVSVLAAFFMEGLREDLELAREVDQELANVGRELDRNFDLVVVQLETLRQVVDGTDALLRQLDDGVGMPLVSVSDTLVWLSSAWSPSLNPSIGAVEALIASGRLAELQDSDLRLGLAGLRDLLGDAMEEEATARSIVLEQLFPLLRTELDFGAVDRVGMAVSRGSDESGITTQERFSGRAIPSFGEVDYPNSPGIRNVLRLKQAWLRVGVAEYTRILDHMDDLRARLEAELAG